jgi:HJR/Mrr/RecB family endonuclease
MKQLIVPTMFEIGKHYSNDQIHYALEIANLGGIRPKLNSQNQLDFIVLITSAEENKRAVRNPYADRIEGNVLTYTGAGLKGEQEISGVNKRLLEQTDKPIPVLGFAKEAVNQYRFIGFLFILRHYEDYQLDNEGSMRKVWVFEFQIVSEIKKVSIGQFSDIFAPIYNRLKDEVTDDDTKIEDTSKILETNNEIEKLKDVEILKTKLMTVDPYKFEVIISNLINHVGFFDVKVTKKSGDEGVDVNALLKNPVSVDLRYSFQVKRWKHSVGRNEVANLRGSMGLNNQGVIIATSHFTESAIYEAKSENKTPINLVGIKELYYVIQSTNFKINEHLF